MSDLMFPKPPKKKKKSRGYIKVNKQPERKPTIIQRSQESYLSKSTQDLNIHEPIGAGNRRMSMAEGLWIYVTRDEHTWLHSTHEGELRNRQLKSIVQAMWFLNKSYEGYDWDQAEKEWRDKFVESYL